MGLGVLGALLLVAQPFAHGQSANITRRDVSPGDLSNYRSGLFVVASTQTSCEMALFDSSAGFVPASCLTYKDDGEVDNSIDYRVAVTAAGGSGAKIHSVTMVDAHPGYNPRTNANNIAVLHWGDPNDITWRQKIALDRPSWSNMFYTRQTMSSVSKSSWNSPVVQVAGGNSDAGGCDQADNVYKSNKGSFSCIVQSTTSIANGNCQTPYGAAWAIYQPNNVAIAALYSHTAIYKGNKMCGSTGDQYHYYTLLQPYAAWAAKMTGRKVNTYTSDSSYSYSGSSSFGMANDNASGVSGVNTVSGDLYPVAKAYTGPPGSASNSGGGDSGGGDSGGGDSGGGDSGGGDTGGGDTGGGDTGGGDNGGGDNGGGDNGGGDTGGGDNGGGDSGGGNNGGDSGSNSDNKSPPDDNTTPKSDRPSKPTVIVQSGITITVRVTDGSSNDSHRSQGGRGPNSGALEDAKSRHGVPVLDIDGGDGEPQMVPGVEVPPGDGLSRTAIIAVATAVPVGTILILVMLFFAYKWWRKRQNMRNWDPKSEVANIDRIRIIEELNGPTSAPNPHLSTPPAYFDLEFRSTFEPAGKA